MESFRRSGQKKCRIFALSIREVDDARNGYSAVALTHIITQTKLTHDL